MHFTARFKKISQMFINFKKQIAFIAILIVASMQSYAQIPLNDDPCLDPNFPGTGAIDLIANAACSFTTFSNVDASATAGVANPACGTYTDGDVWFTTTVPVGATSIVIDTRSGPANGPTQPALTNGALNAYTATGTCPNLTFTSIGCNDNNGASLMPRLTLTAAPGTVIYIRMWGVGGGSGTFGICVTANIPPANNECINAQLVTVNANLLCGVVTAGTTNNATQSSTLPNPTCGIGNAWNDDVWFSFVATGVAHRVSLLNVAGGSTSLIMQVYSGTCAALTPIACLNGNTLDVGGLTAGNTYYVRVYTNVTSTATATFNICVGTPPPPPANDECINAVLVSVNPTYTCTNFTSGTTVSATQSLNTPLPSCSATGVNDDVWYSFIATGTGHRVSLLNVLPANAMGITAYSGTCTSLVEIGCSNSGVLNLTGLIAGTTYLVRIYTTSTVVGTTSAFQICVGTPPPPPSNDDCLNATSLTINADFNCAVVTAGTTISATQSTTTPLPTCGTTGINDDVWYSFTTTATSTAHRITLTGVLPVNAMGIATYSGTCAALVQNGCSTTGLLNLVGLTPNTTYYVRIFTISATPFVESNFNICVGTPPPPPVNDNCLTAISATVNPNYFCGTVSAGTIVSATPTIGVPAPSCNAAGADDDVWFSFLATNATHRISLLNIVGTVTALTSVVYSGPCNALVEVSCNATNLYNVTGLTPGQIYYIRVFTTTTIIAQEVNFNLCIGTPPPPPANDNCAGAISLTVNANQLCAVTTSGTTAGATQSTTTPTPTCSGPNGWDDDVWYTFIAVGTAHTVRLLNVTGLTTNMLTSVYSGNCGALVQIGCSGVDPNVVNLTSLVAGNTYYVRVQTELTGVDANFSICVGTPGPGETCGASNQFCAGTGFSQPGVVNQPSLGGGGVYGCLGSTPNPTWYYIEVTQSGNLNFTITQTNAAGVPIDVDFAVWGPFTSQASACTQLAATPTTLTPTACSFSISGTEIVNVPNVVAGQWYALLVTNFNGGVGTVAFNPNPSNTAQSSCPSLCSSTNNGPICVGSPFNLTTTVLSGTTSYAWTGPGGFTSTVQNPTNISAPSTPGNYTYNVTLTSGTVTCNTSTVLSVVLVPAAPVVVSPVTYCQNATATALSATALPSHTLLWYANAVGGVGSTTAIIPSTTTVGSTIYYVSQKIGLCEGPRAAITVNIIVSTTAPVVVVTPVNYCQGAIATSLASSATAVPGATLLWYSAAIGGTGSNIAPVPSTATAGSTTYYVSQIIGTCEGLRTAIIVNVTAYSTSPVVTTPVNYCVGNTSVALTASGTNLLWYTAAVGGAVTSTAPIPNTASPSNITYFVTQTGVNGCASLRVPITVNVFANPTIPTVVSPVVYCQGVTTAVPLTVTTGSAVTWFTVPTGGIALPGAPTPSTTNVGNTTYYVQSNNGTCFSTRAAILVTINPTPLAPTVVSPVVYCQAETAIALTAGGTNLLWYVPLAGGGTIVTGVAPTPSTSNVGSVVYQVSSTIGTCEGPKATITVNVNITPFAPTVISPVTYCQSATASPLIASGSGLLWYLTPTGGVGNSTVPTPSTAAGGTTTYYVSSKIGNCEGPRSPIIVTVTATPAAPTVTTPVVYCQGATPVVLTANGTSLLWYNSAAGGTGSTTVPTPNTTNVGSTNYYVTQSTSGVVCESPRALIVVTVNAKPLAPTVVSPITYCQTVNASALIAVGATGNTFLWYNVAIGGTSSNTAPLPTTSTVGSTTYYVSQTTALNCEGPRVPITVDVTPVLTVNAGNDTIMARGNTIQLNGSSTGVANATYLWTANITPLALSSATILKPFANPIATTIYTLRATDPSGRCPSVTDNVKVEVVQSCVNVRNAFTPNGDGINDKWFIYDQNFCLSNPGGAKVNVYNRYGSKVYESKDYTNSWDGTYKGKAIPDGTYYAVIEFVLFDGSKQIVRTDLTIIR